MEWKSVSALIAVIERREAKAERRVVSVATNAVRLPAADGGRHVHKGQFGGWLLEAAELDDGLVAVIRFNDGALLGVKADGEEVGVSNE